MTTTHPLLQQTDLRQALGGWHAEPLEPVAAEALLGAVHAHQQKALWGGAVCPGCRVAAMVARFWLGRSVELDIEQARQLAEDTTQAALAELVYGQLLASRKLAGAHRQLKRGFALAAGELGPGAYLRVLRRHERLRHLPLGEQPAPPASLDALLREASVIAQLRRPRRRVQGGGTRRDTVG